MIRSHSTIQSVITEQARVDRVEFTNDNMQYPHNSTATQYRTHPRLHTYKAGYPEDEIPLQPPDRVGIQAQSLPLHPTDTNNYCCYYYINIHIAVVSPKIAAHTLAGPGPSTTASGRVEYCDKAVAPSFCYTTKSGNRVESAPKRKSRMLPV